MGDPVRQAREDAALLLWARRFLLSGQARAWREGHGLTLHLMARAAGVDESDLSRWERGYGGPGLAAAARYASAYRELDEIARGDGAA